MSDDARFFAFLKERIGLDVASVGEAIIERAVRQRCTALQAEDHDAYWQVLRRSADEQQALIEAVIVPETWFFRYPESFVTLGKLASARLAKLAGARPLRILSLPCSTGEEPYSIAMGLFDAGLQPQQFKVDAVDISPISLQRARRGVYGKNSFRGDPIDFRERYFSPVEDGYRLDERVRERVTFQVGNMLDPTLLVAQSAYDFVFCRNLLIYFDLATQKLGFEALKRMTRDDGLLFIGPAEGSLLGRMGMVSIGIPQSFAFRHRVDTDAPLFFPGPVLPGTAASSVAQPDASISPPRVVPAPVLQARSGVKLGSNAFLPIAPLRPATGLSSSIAAPSVEAASLLESIRSLANAGKSAEARLACEQYLKRYEPQASVFYWLGLLYEVGGDTAGAQGFYRKALYLDPQHPETLAQMAALLSAQGDSAGARRLQDRAARGVTPQGRDR